MPIMKTMKMNLRIFKSITKRVEDEGPMSVPLEERSKYYRGLLVLARRDQVIDTRERELVLQFGKVLGFDPRFCEAAIDDLLKNRYITDEPATFADRETAECFLRDGIRLAFQDEKIDARELSWLRAVAQANGLTKPWLDDEIRHYQEAKDSLGSSDMLDIRRLLP